MKISGLFKRFPRIPKPLRINVIECPFSQDTELQSGHQSHNAKVRDFSNESFVYSELNFVVCIPNISRTSKEWQNVN